MDPQALLDLLIVASGAQTDEEKARIAWRANDYMWRLMPAYGLGLCRHFNNLLQDQDWPWVKNLWSTEEMQAYRAQFNVGRNPDHA